MSVRLRRLAADEAEVRRALADHPYIRLLEAEGAPAERYRLEYYLKGVVVQGRDIVEKDRHRVEVFLTLGYPRQAPQCRMLTPIFHPNIAPHAICIGDHWTAGESLVALLVRIGEMITYQSYNLKSPLNGEAARWAAENVGRLPIERADLGSDGTAAPAEGPPLDAIPDPAGPGEGTPAT